MDFKLGDWVRCIDDSGLISGAQGPLLRAGNLYRVMAVQTQNISPNRGAYVAVADHTGTPVEDGTHWHPARFEPAWVTEYVLGFAHSADYVLLARKARPEAQKGKLNGLGGKLEVGETPLEAMLREAKEEANLDPLPWKPLALMRFPACRIHVFHAELHDLPVGELLATGRSGVDEPTNWYSLRGLTLIGWEQTVTHVPVLLALALDGKLIKDQPLLQLISTQEG